MSDPKQGLDAIQDQVKDKALDALQQSLSSEQSTPNVPELPTCPAWEPDEVPDWAKEYYGNPAFFHAGYSGFIEDTQTWPESVRPPDLPWYDELTCFWAEPPAHRPIQECFYDEVGRLVDDAHPFAGAGGSPNQYDSASNPFAHAMCDDGGVLSQAGVDGALASGGKLLDNMGEAASESFQEALDNLDQAVDQVGDSQNDSSLLMEGLGVAFAALKVVVDPIQSAVDEAFAYFFGPRPALPASAHFDLVLGLDIHTVIIPPAPSPIPMPHLHLGLVFDFFDYLPGIFATTVHVHGRKFAGGGTGGKAFPHIPMGVTFAPWPAHESEILLGSSTVWADAMPFSSLGQLTLTCQFIGIPGIPRGRLSRKRKGLMLPLGVVIPIPFGAPVLVGGPPTISVMAFAMKGIMGALGRVAGKIFGPFIGAFRKWQKGSKAWKALSDALNKANSKLFKGLDSLTGKKFSRFLDDFRAKKADDICTLTGHPVDVASGRVVTSDVDLTLPGPLPLVFQRRWDSSSTWLGELGHGWHHSLEACLFVSQEGVVVHLPDGRLLPMFHPSPGLPVFHPGEKLELRLDAEGYVLEDNDGHQYHFGGAGMRRAWLPPEGAPPRTLWLQEIRDSNGNRIRVEREAGVLVAIHDSAGRTLPVHTDARGRVVELRGPDPKRPGHTVSLVRYSYSGDGDLAVVTDADGAPFSYRYQAHLLVQETDRQGVSFYFEYDGEDHRAWCTRTWGDRGVLSRALAYDREAGVTRVTDSRGVSVYHWDDTGLVTRHIDATGAETAFEFDAAGNKLAEIDPLGNRSETEYNDRGQVIRVTDATGASTRLDYDARGDVVAVTNALGATWRYRYDARRNLSAVEDPEGGRWRYEVDSRGLPLRSIDPLGHATELEWTEAGDLRRMKDRAGGLTRLRHDALGRLTRRVDPEGGQTLLSWSLTGRLQEVLDASGRRSRYRYDGAGNLVEAVDPMGRARRYSYGPLGVIQRTVEPSGLVTEYGYDAELDLQVVVDARGKRWTFDRDAEGRVLRETSFDGRVERYERDPAGRLTATIKNSGLRAELTRDAEGRLLAARYPSGREEQLSYDPLGRLVLAVGQAVAEWRYDALGRVVSERLDGHEVQSDYDAVGNRLRRRSPFGRTLELAYDPEGRLAKLSEGERTLMRLRYDGLGRERRRDLPNGVVSVRDYLPTGELKSSLTVHAGQTLLKREYHYNAAGEVEAIGREGALTRYTHDLDGRLVAEIYPDERVKRYHFDAAGNVPGVPDGRWDDDGCFRSTVDGWWLTYDADGNLIAKVGDHVGWRYEFDEAGRLARVRRGPGRLSSLGVQALARDADGTDVEVTFTYDPLSRRREKRIRWADGREEVVEFVWDGAQCVEWSRQTLDGVRVEQYSLLARPGSWEYLVGCSRNAAGLFVVECDQVDTPIGTYPCVEAQIQVNEGFPGDGGPRGPGEHVDTETGLAYNLHRYNDASLGRYLAADPIGLLGGPTPWGLVPDPLSQVDPLGLMPLKDGIPQNPGTVRRFVSKAEYKELRKNGFTFDPNDSRGGLSATSTHIDPRNPDALRRSTGALSADYAVDIDTRGLDVVQKGKTKGGVMDWKIRSSFEPERVTPLGKCKK